MLHGKLNPHTSFHSIKKINSPTISQLKRSAQCRLDPSSLRNKRFIAIIVIKNGNTLHFTQIFAILSPFVIMATVIKKLSKYLSMLAKSVLAIGELP